MTSSYGQAGIDAGGQDALATTLHSVARFLRTVRLRSGILLMSLVTACVLGTLYYITAPRIFQATASLYVVKMAGVSQDSLPTGGDPSRSMPTFRSLMSSQQVLETTLERLPEKIRKQEFDGLNKLQAVMQLQDSLSVSSEFNTQILDLRYRSEDPHTAATILAHILVSYMSFMDDVNRGSSDQNLERLEEQLREVKQIRIEAMNRRQALIRSAPDLVGAGDDTLNASIERMKLLQQLISDATQELTDARATAEGLGSAIRNKQDILQYTDALREHLIADAAGIGGQSGLRRSRLYEEITDLTSRLKTEQRGKGDQHPEIQAIREEIQIREQELAQMSARTMHDLKTQGYVDGGRYSAGQESSGHAAAAPGRDATGADSRRIQHQRGV